MSGDKIEKSEGKATTKGKYKEHNNKVYSEHKEEMATEISKGFVTRMPLFVCDTTKKGFIIIGGGGGASKTGIPNGFLFFRWKQESMEKIGEFDTESQAVMTFAAHPHENSLIYPESGKKNLVKISFEIAKDKSTTSLVPTGGVGAQLTYSRCDFKVKSAKHCKVLKLSNGKGDRLAVGSEDGYLHILQYITLATVDSTTAHSGEIDDIAWHPRNDLLCTIGKDKVCKIWRFEDNTLRFERALECGAQQMLKGCAFAPTVGPPIIYTAACVRSKATFISEWDVASGKLLQNKRVHNNHCTHFVISPKGTFTAVADSEGYLVVLSTSGFKRAMKIKPHTFIIPAVCFSPSVSANRTNEVDDSSSIITAGTDCVIRYHKIQIQSKCGHITMILCFMVVLIVLCVYLTK